MSKPFVFCGGGWKILLKKNIHSDTLKKDTSTKKLHTTLQIYVLYRPLSGLKQLLFAFILAAKITAIPKIPLYYSSTPLPQHKSNGSTSI